MMLEIINKTAAVRKLLKFQEYRCRYAQIRLRSTSELEQKASIKNTVNKIVKKDINPHVDQWEKEKQFPIHDVFKLLGKAGCLGITKPQKYGGLGLDYTYELAFSEAVGNIDCMGVPTAIGVQTDYATPALSRFGSESLCRQFLVPTIAGDTVACVGISEPSAGSDVANIRTTARKEGGDYVISGSKMWITNGIQADWICLLVNTSAGPIHSNKSLIIVPMNLPGVHRVRKIGKLGLWCSDTAELHFDDVRVPQSYRIGDEGKGFTYQMLQFQEERLYGSAIVLTPLQKLIDQTVEYTAQRQLFGRSVLSHQVVHFRMAELATDLEAFRSLIYKAVGRYVDGHDVSMLAAMAKLKAGRLSREISDSCLQYWGGMGFTDEVLVSRMYRDLRLKSIGAGADEVMLSIIAKHMGILPSRKPQSTKTNAS